MCTSLYRNFLGKRYLVIVPLVLALAACGDNGGTPGGGRVVYSVAGTTDVADSGLVLELNGAHDMTVAPSQRQWQFPVGLTDGSPYAVTVKDNPQTQTCNVVNGAGTIAGANILGIAVTCSDNRYTIGGSVNYSGTGLVLEDTDSKQQIQITASGPFTITPGLTRGSNYSLVADVSNTSPTQRCTVQNGTGTVSTGDVTNIAVTCTVSPFLVGGSIAGLAGSNMVITETNSGQIVTPSIGNTSFQFKDPLPSGAAYNVTVKSPTHNSTGLTQNCSVVGGSGTIGASDVESIQINCKTQTYAVGGVIRGLSPNVAYNIALHDDINGGQTTVTQNGSFTLDSAVPDGSSYSISIGEPNALMTNCMVQNRVGANVVAGAAVTSISIACNLVGRFLYAVAGSFSNYKVAGFCIDQRSGAVQAVRGPGLCGQPGAVGGNIAVPAGAQSSFAPPVPTIVGGNGYLADALMILPNSDGTVSSYLLDGIGGGILAVQTTPSGSGSSAVSPMVLNSTNSVAYLTNNFGTNNSPGAFAAFTVNSAAFDNLGAWGTTTALTFIDSITLPTQGAPSLSLSLTPNGKYAYGILNQQSVAAALITPPAGGLAINQVVQIQGSAGASVGPLGATVSGTGKSLYVSVGPVSQVATLSIDPTTGKLTQTGAPIGDTGVVGFPSSFQPPIIDPSGSYLFALNYNDNSISAFTIDASGALAVAPGGPFRATYTIAPQWAIIDPSGTYLYVLNTLSANISAYRINLANPGVTPALSLIGVYPSGGTLPQGQLTFDPSGAFLYVFNSVEGTLSAFFVDANSGKLTSVAGSPFGAGSSAPFLGPPAILP